MKTVRSKVLFALWLVFAFTVGTLGVIYLPSKDNFGIFKEKKNDEIEVRANSIVSVFVGRDKDHSIIQVNEDGQLRSYEVECPHEEVTARMHTGDGSQMIKFKLREKKDE